VWEWVAETHGLPVTGTVLPWVSKSDTIPIPMNYPNDSKHLIANMVISGLTQYLTCMQGIPTEIEQGLTK